MKIKNFTKYVLGIVSLFAAIAFVGTGVILAIKNSQENISLPEGNRYDLCTVSIRSQMQHDFALTNATTKTAELNAFTTNCCSLTTVTPLKLTLRPNQKGKISVRTSAVGSGERSEGIEMATTSAGKSESIWLFINYIVPEKQWDDAIHQATH